MSFFKKIIHTLQTDLVSRLTLIFFVSAIIPVILSIIFIYNNLYSTFREKEIDIAVNQMELCMSELDEIYIEIQTSISGILTYNEVYEILDSDYSSISIDYFNSNSELKNILKLAAPYSEQNGYTFTILGENGINASNYSNINIFKTFDDADFSKIMDGGYSLEIFTREVFPYADVDYLTFGKKVYNGDECVGLLLGELDTSYIDDIFFYFEDSNTKYYILDYEYDTVIYSNETNFENLDFTEIISNTDENNTIKIDSYSYYVFMDNSLYGNYKIAILMPVTTIYGDSTNLLSSAIPVVLLIIAFTILFSRITVSQTTSKVIALNKEVKSFLFTHQTFQYNTGYTHDDIDELYQNVSDMSMEINRMVDNVKVSDHLKRKHQFKALQSQMSPHLIYNTLNTITELASIQGVSNIEEVSTSFTNMLLMIAKEEHDFITLEDELEYCKNFVNIKKYGSLMTMDIKVNISEELKKLPILKLIIQPFVENSIKHGFKDITQSYLIEISVKMVGKFIVVKIYDNGIGMTKETVHDLLYSKSTQEYKFTSIGIKNSLERLELHYGSLYKFNITSKIDKFTEITLTYPITSKEDFFHD